MENHTIGDGLAEATEALENAVETNGYQQLPARHQAYLQEALYYLDVVQGDNGQEEHTASGVTALGERR